MKLYLDLPPKMSKQQHRIYISRYGDSLFLTYNARPRIYGFEKAKDLEKDVGALLKTGLYYTREEDMEVLKEALVRAEENSPAAIE